MKRAARGRCGSGAACERAEPNDVVVALVMAAVDDGVWCALTSFHALFVVDAPPVSSACRVAAPAVPRFATDADSRSATMRAASARSGAAGAPNCWRRLCCCPGGSGGGCGCVVNMCWACFEVARSCSTVLGGAGGSVSQALWAVGEIKGAMR